MKGTWTIFPRETAASFDSPIACILSLVFGGFMLALGQFISGLTKDQIVAYLLTLMAGAVFCLSGHELLTGVLDGLWPARQVGTLLRESFSALPHYEAFTRGLIDLRSV